jgi:hypothetical protein
MKDTQNLRRINVDIDHYINSSKAPTSIFT